ncbi:hypothetical protein AB0C02_21575 [Micromonospora sp. NPDC048999]|uniref:hypothetical protein n=1 Tax=Micromonospora sp. NPDC048999 TaxID=3155391 RepID=UPI003404D2AC
MNGRRKVFILLGVAGLGVAVLALVIGVKGAGDLVGLVSAFVSAAVGVLALATAMRLPGSPEGQGADAPDGRTGPVRRPPVPPPHRRWLRLLLPAALSVLLLVLTWVTVVRWPPDRRDAEAGPTASATATPATTPPASTEASPSPSPTDPPWIPPADAPRWTLRANDSIAFRPEPALTRNGGTGLIFQPEQHQLAWYQWTDDPKDLSYAGCRSARATRWDAIDLKLVGRKPRTYCQPDPADPTVVNYVRILGNRYDGHPPSVDVQVWSVID